MAIYSIVPFVAMISMNIAIFIRLRQRDQQYNECAKLAVNGESKKVRPYKLCSNYISVSHRHRENLNVYGIISEVFAKFGA